MFIYKTMLEKRFAREALSQVLITFGMLLIISDLCRWIWGGNPLAIPKPEALQGTIYLGEIVFPVYRLAVIVMGVLILLFLWWFQERTKYGAIVRAGVDDDEMTQGIGINISLVKTLILAWEPFAGFAGVVGGPFIGLSVGLDIEVLPLACYCHHQPDGKSERSLVGALFIGLVDSFGKSLLPELSIFTIFAGMVIVLAIKPSGLFGIK
jgi:branched-chain amino acid transport system permease protein